VKPAALAAVAVDDGHQPAVHFVAHSAAQAAAGGTDIGSLHRSSPRHHAEAAIDRPRTVRLMRLLIVSKS